MSEQTETRFELRRDGLGIVLFTAGAFFTVLLALALASSEPLERAEGTAALARLWERSIGLVPGLLFCAGSAALGARLFLVGAARGRGSVQRRAGGLALVSLGLSVLLGAFSPTAGGLVGNLTAGLVARGTNSVLGILAGLAVFGVAVWVCWVKPGRGAGAGAPSARNNMENSFPAADPGVSPEEAAALIPEELPRSPSPRPESPGLPIPDPRRRGGVPEGARVLNPSHVQPSAPPGPPVPGEGAIDAPAVPSVQPRTPPAEPAPAADPLDEDLAFAAELDDVIRPFRSPREDALEVEEREELSEAPVEEAAPILRPSWEQPSLFEVGEEPVDAYGTPLDEIEPALHVDEPEEAPVAVEEASEEADAVLKPATGPAKKRRKRRGPELSAERSRLLAEVGCLLVERGRVAVSMLQKQYEMDFEEATKVLDELQALGLIGPYLGGQRRDILLTRDEWLEKVSTL